MSGGFISQLLLQLYCSKNIRRALQTSIRKLVSGVEVLLTAKNLEKRRAKMALAATAEGSDEEVRTAKRVKLSVRIAGDEEDEELHGELVAIVE